MQTKELKSGGLLSFSLLSMSVNLCAKLLVGKCLDLNAVGMRRESLYLCVCLLSFADGIQKSGVV